MFDLFETEEKQTEMFASSDEIEVTSMFDEDGRLLVKIAKELNRQNKAHIRFGMYNHVGSVNAIQFEDRGSCTVVAISLRKDAAKRAFELRDKATNWIRTWVEDKPNLTESEELKQCSLFDILPVKQLGFFSGDNDYVVDHFEDHNIYSKD